MSEYREENNRRKAVQAGIIELRPLCSSAPKKSNGDWLIVELQVPKTWRTNTPLQRERVLAKPCRFKILGDYKSEEIAQRTREKSFRLGWMYGKTFYCHREVFDRVYKHLEI